MKINAIASSAVAVLLAMPLAAPAATDAELDEVIATARLLKHRYEQQQQVILALQRRINQLEGHLAGGLEESRGRGAPEQSESMTRAIAQANNGHAPQLAQNTQTLPSSMPGGPATAQGTLQLPELAVADGTPLFDRKFSIEQGLTYTHYDKRSLVLSGFLALDAILLGQINLQQIKTDQLQYDVTGRWNISNRISMDLNVPMLYRRSNYISPGAGGSAASVSDASSSSTSLGDVNVGAYYHLPKSAPTDLDWIASVRLKAPTGRHPFGIKLRNADPNNSNLVIPSRQPTGNGVWNTSFGLSVLKAYDPVVLFGNVGLSYNFDRSFGDLSSTIGTVTPGEVKLGHAWTFGGGFALALNDRMSISFSYAQLIQKAARLRAEGGPWVRQVGTDVNSATFNSSLTHQLSPRLSMVGTASLGLTPDAPDFSIGIKFPYSF